MRWKGLASCYSVASEVLSIRKYVIIYDDRFTPVRIVAIAGGSQDLSRLLDIDPRFDDFDED